MPPKLKRAFVKWLVRETDESATLANEIVQELSLRSSSSSSSSSSSPRCAEGSWERLRSWKFPGILAIEVEGVEALLRRQRGTFGEFYILLLELAYDRIHFLLRLLAEFAKTTEVAGDEESREAEVEGWADEDADGSYVANAARFVWSQLQRRAEWRHRRLASLDEARVALASRLASMAETKVALEKTIVDSRPPDPPLANLPREDSPRGDERPMNLAASLDGYDSQREGEEQRKDSSSLTLINPDDDPLADMTRELASNQARIEDLSRQNERISRLIARISEHRRADVP